MNLGTPANAIGGDILHLSGGVWRDDDNEIRFPTEISAIVLPDWFEAPLTCVAMAANGRCGQIDIVRHGGKILVQVGPEVTQ